LEVAAVAVEVVVELVVELVCVACPVEGDADEVLVLGALAVGVFELPASGSVYCVPPASWARATAGNTASATTASRAAIGVRITGVLVADVAGGVC
jgi:hypothetical protein